MENAAVVLREGLTGRDDLLDQRAVIGQIGDGGQQPTVAQLALNHHIILNAHLYIVSCYIEMDKTSWKPSSIIKVNELGEFYPMSFLKCRLVQFQCLKSFTYKQSTNNTCSYPDST